MGDKTERGETRAPTAVGGDHIGSETHGVVTGYASGGEEVRGRRVNVRLAGLYRVLRALSRRAWFIEDEVLGLEQIVKPGDVCLDIGAEYGLYTVALARLAGPDGRVYGFEPQVGAFRILTAALGLAGCRNARAHRVALADRDGRGVLSVPRRWGLPVHGRAFLFTDCGAPDPNDEFASSRRVEVDVLTLDRFCDRERIEHVDFIKADVEGAELSVLHGGAATLARHRPCLQLEIQDPYPARFGVSSSQVAGWLTDRGYVMYAWRAGAWTPVASVTTAHRNYMFVPEDRRVGWRSALSGALPRVAGAAAIAHGSPPHAPRNQRCLRLDRVWIATGMILAAGGVLAVNHRLRRTARLSPQSRPECG